MKLQCVYVKDAALYLTQHQVGMYWPRVKHLSAKQRVYLMIILNLVSVIWYEEAPECQTVKEIFYRELKYIMCNRSSWYRFLRACKKNKIMYTQRVNGKLQYCFYVCR